MSRRPGRRLHGGGSSGGSQHDLRIRKREKAERHDRDHASEFEGNDAREKTEDVRISRLTRSLARLESEESFFTLCGQIEGALTEVENQRYVSRCFQCLNPSFLEVFKGLSGLSWEAAASKRYAQLLSKICYSMEKQTSKLFQWLVDIITRTARGSHTHASASVYVMEAVSVHLISFLEVDDIITFIRSVYEILDDVANPRVFRVLGAIFVCGTNVTAGSWRNPHFQDFIDMVVGWMVDVRQAHGQFTSCAELLENSRPQFERDLRFLVTLMSQLLEDLEQGIKKVQPTSQSDSAEEFRKVLQLIRAFTSLEALECPLDKSVLTEFCDKLVTSTLQFIRMCEPHQNMDRKYRYDLLTTVNKALFYAGGVMSQSITKYYRAQLKLGTTNSSYLRWPKIFFTSFLESITVWAEAIVSQSQLSDDIMEICGTLMDMMEDMRKSLPSHDQHYVLTLIGCLLRTRNVVLLQKSYAWLIEKLPSGDREQSETVGQDEVILFVLAGLTDKLSNKGSSILSLWALQPAVFDLLVSITNMNVHPRTLHCAMDLLKTHCTMHSHFVSSIASAGSFNTESPGSKFLPALMEFWLDKISSLHQPENKWLTDWVFEFLQGSSSYSTLLYNAKPEFYKGFLEVVTQKTPLQLQGAKILEWLCQDPGYSQLESLNLIIRERVITVILDGKLPERIKEKYRNALYCMHQLVIIPDIIFIEDCMETDVAYEQDDNLHESSHKPQLNKAFISQKQTTRTSALIQTEFNQFLYELLIGNSAQPPQITTGAHSNKKEVLSLAADHLLRLKLKTPLGKPQDFFGHLLLLFKRSRNSKISLPIWKLHFVFELEKKFQLWTHGSAIDETEITEHIKQFYLMNKSPFLEWLKRIRSEIIDTSTMCGEYPLAYFNSALMGDSQKMEYVLYQIKDSLGLKGMGNLAAHYYLEGKYEEAMSFISSQDEISSELCDEIKMDVGKMLEDSCNCLQKWSVQTNELKEFKELDSCVHQKHQLPPSLSNLLDFQLQNNEKSDLTFLLDVDHLESLQLPAIQKIHTWLKNFPDSISTMEQEIRDNFERIRLDKMLKAGNLKYVGDWLVRNGIDVNSILSDEDFFNLSLTSLPVSTLKVCADFYAKKSHNRKSIVLYNILRELATENLNADLASQVTLNLASRILESEECFTIFNTESLSDDDRLETVKSLHEIVLQSYPDCAKMWLSYGDFLQEQIEKKDAQLSHTQPMKQTAVECYKKYVQLSQERVNSAHKLPPHISTHTPKLVVMARLLQLSREGVEFDFKEIINDEDWLVFLAEIAQIPEMRSFMVDKYPEQVALFFSCHNANAVTNKRTVRRRNLFDLSPYAYVDTSEEPLSSNVILSNLSQLGKQDAVVTEKNMFQYYFRSDINMPETATILVHELLQLASSMEDMWVWSLERIAIDWSRRLTYLRKEYARSLSTENIQAFVQPIRTYLEALLAQTVASDSSVDVNFLNRYKKDIEKLLNLLATCVSLEEVCETMNSLMRYAERFGQLMNNKLPLSLFSSKLASRDFYQDSKFSICLPGQPTHIKICGLHSSVHALPTKTKPKRIRILANNGKYYDYLVKGTENLNIDCGVMLFFKVAQSFFKLPTRTYSVTPLGKRGGLIQIVPDAVPLFTLYKRHLQRNKCLEKTSEMFWRRMNGLGYDDRSSLVALREVFETLSSETSCDLISRELLLSASTPTEWMNSVKTFTKDCAVGAALGYLLGIGDRHLDNMLVNINQGKFIHVDFSIIFGRGAALRVPELVPFRLTQNIKSVLQYPGSSGVFYVVMQDVMNSFQECRSTVMHLIKNIAFCHQYDEDTPVDPTQVLLSEVEATIKLFLCRSRQYLPMLHLLRSETQEIANDSDSSRKISRKMNRWRRMLVNLNTILQFISSVAHVSSPYNAIITLTQHQWTELFQTSLEMGMEQKFESARFLELLDVTEQVVEDLQSAFTIGECDKCSLDMLKLNDSNIHPIDMNKVETLVKYSEMNIQTFNPSTTVRRLIDEATSVDNLSQMYEGWTPWV